MLSLLATPLDSDPSLGEVTAAYDAARVSPRDSGFVPQGLGPNAEAERFGSIDRIWARSTHLHDNNELVDAAAEADIDRVIGTGIDDIEPDTGWSDVDDQIASLYEYAFQAVDPQRSMSLAEAQGLYWREMRRTGECSVRIVMAEAFNGFPMMPAIELIEAERIPPTLTGINPATKNRVRQGVEYDDAWRIVAYHVLVANPRDGDPKFGWLGGFGGFLGNIAFGSPDLVRVPATEMRLSMNRRRIRQMRGVPGLVSAMRTIRTEDSYVDGQMAHARTAGSLGMIFDVNDAQMFAPKNGKMPLLVDGAGNPLTSLEGVGVAFRKPGSQAPTLAHLNLPGPQLPATTEMLQMRQSRGLNCPYSQLSGNYTKETFASNRANRIDQRQRDVRNQHTMVWGHLTRPFCRTLVQYGVLAQRVTFTVDRAKKIDQIAELRADPERLYRSNVPTPGEAYVNPQQESSAVQTDLMSFVTSEIETFGRRGSSWKRGVRQRAKFWEFVKDECIKAGLDPDLFKPAGTLPEPAGEQDTSAEGDNAARDGAGNGKGAKQSLPPGGHETAEQEIEAEERLASGETAIEPEPDADGGIEDGVGLRVARARRSGGAGTNGTLNGVHHR